MVNDFSRSKKKVWIHGHTHTTLDPISLRLVDQTSPFNVCSFEHHPKYCTLIYFDNEHNLEAYMSLMAMERIDVVEASVISGE